MKEQDIEVLKGKLVKGDIIEVEFLDHYTFDRVPFDMVQDTAPCLNKLIGYFHSIEDDHLRIVWLRDGMYGEGRKVVEEVTAGMAIIASTMTSLRIVESVKPDELEG